MTSLPHEEMPTAAAPAGSIEREPEVDHGDVDRVVANDLFGLPRHAGLHRLHAQRPQQAVEGVGPGIRPPSSPGKQQVEPAAGRRAADVGAGRHHRTGSRVTARRRWGGVTGKGIGMCADRAHHYSPQGNPDAGSRRVPARPRGQFRIRTGLKGLPAGPQGRV